MNIQSKLMQFARARGGNVAITFAIMMVPLLGSIVLAVDYSNMERTRDRLQNASDAGALMAARYYEDNGKMPDEKAVKQFIKANTEVDSVDLTRLKRGANGQIYVTVKAPYDPFIMQAIWDRDYTIKVKSVSVAGQDQIIEVAMALDTTESMINDGKLDGLKKAATNFTNTLFDAATGNSEIKIGIVPFNVYVNVGLQYRNEKWLKLPDAGSRLWYTEYKEQVKDPDTCRKEYVNRDGVLSYEEVCDYKWTGNIIREDLEWNGCVGSRGTNADRIALEDETTDLVSWPEVRRFPALPGARCGDPLLPLTKKKQDVLDAIDNLWVYSRTYIADGVMWGLRILSSVAPFSEGADQTESGNGQVRKILIVMSDGDNTLAPRMDNSIYNAFHEATYKDENRLVSDPTIGDEWTREACEHAKSRGVEIFSIAYGTEVSASGKKVLKDCASSGAHFFDAKSASALDTTFQKIAEALTRLRLVK
ncbi:MAG: pilus assembly protein TadG-related protein [Zhengella sp.]|uniref:vWA domain-containing protein n=1 Tax=Zhengella sp. TaxID=2282762 RepID=UPI001D53A721|nr:hypothetical protein [Notoacmeibacter sp.]MCC0027323.1 hypothetical protein [Brucellaceae bacterium]